MAGKSSAARIPIDRNDDEKFDQRKTREVQGSKFYVQGCGNWSRSGDEVGSFS